MGDDRDERIRQALRDYVADLPLVVSEQMVQERLARPSRSLWPASALVLAGLIVVVAVFTAFQPWGEVGASPTASAFAAGSATPFESSPSPGQTARVTYPRGCGVSYQLDYLSSLGTDPERALAAFIESVRSRPSGDDKAQAERDAILSSASLVVNEGNVQAETRFVARDADGVLAIYALSEWPNGGYIVSWYWVRLPSVFCEEDGQ